MQLDPRLWNPAVIADALLVLCCLITASIRSAKSYRQRKIRKKSQARAERELGSLFDQYDELQTLVNRITREAIGLKRKHSDIFAISPRFRLLYHEVMEKILEFFEHLDTLKEAGELRESYCHLSAAWVPIKIEVTMADQIARDMKDLVALRAYFKESLEEAVSYRSLKIPEHWPRTRAIIEELLKDIVNREWYDLCSNPEAFTTMLASFADYPVTKLDADRHVKPMRTYGKRPATKLRVNDRRKEHDSGNNSSTASSSTKIDSSSAISNVESNATTGPAGSEGEKEPPAKKLKSKHGSSILNYYKPVPAATPITITSEDTVVAVAAPSSPCREIAQATTKRRRRLKIRPTDPPSSPAKPARPTKAQPEEKENAPSAPETEEETEETPKPATAKPTPTVQTTLNISSKPSFSECKVCDTVWNPLYPDDEKYHKKRHAAVLRAKKRKADVLD